MPLQENGCGKTVPDITHFENAKHDSVGEKCELIHRWTLSCSWNEHANHNSLFSSLSRFAQYKHAIFIATRAVLATICLLTTRDRNEKCAFLGYKLRDYNAKFALQEVFIGCRLEYSFSMLSSADELTAVVKSGQKLQSVSLRSFTWHWQISHVMVYD